MPAVGLAVAAVAAVAALVAVGLLVTRDDEAGTAGQGGESVAHIHGLGRNPADGQLYAATHYGLFRIAEDGRAVRAGEVRDLMGFTVAGPDVFLASGHPGGAGDQFFESGRRPLLGLIRSSDGGESWKSVSLLGEVDFHSLRAAHGRVYGYDSTTGRFMVSGDGERWDARATIPMGDFAVSPADPDRIVAMTGQGLSESVDGGRHWSAVEGPAAAFLSWHEDAGLWAVGDNGAVSVRTASGWEERQPLPGRPQALLLTDDGVYAAASADGSTGIYESEDGGRSWHVWWADGR
ncbi:MAG: exo-alpha-sialidase [Actinobacteria bacterium]|nr:exo-alpha-sialidase [Actinomycetota bacterium]